MVGDHVAQSTGFLIKLSASFNSYCLGHRDLDMINSIAIPDWFEKAVRKTEHHYVLDGFFSEEVVDAVDLLFIEHFQKFLVEFAGRRQIVTERLFDYNATPMSILLARQSRFAKMLDHRREKAVRDREVEQIVPTRLLLRVDV